jgi:adenine phosphoribosyltransferase
MLTFEDLRTLVRDVPDFPSPGITFRDITPLLGDAHAFGEVIQRLTARYAEQRIDLVAGIESRGFLFAAPLALTLQAGLVPVRKLGKLPAETIGRSYSLEYGSNHLEMHRDAVQPGQRVLLVDDVLATGGTARASAEMIEELGGTVVEATFVVELSELAGRERLAGYPIFSLMVY